MLKKVREIEISDIKMALKDVVFQLFTPGKVDIVMTVAPNLKEASTANPLIPVDGC
jgi:hypothetical protein